MSTGLEGTSAPAVHALTVFDDGAGPALCVGAGQSNEFETSPSRRVHARPQIDASTITQSTPSASAPGPVLCGLFDPHSE